MRRPRRLLVAAVSLAVLGGSCTVDAPVATGGGAADGGGSSAADGGLVAFQPSPVASPSAADGRLEVVRAPLPPAESGQGTVLVAGDDVVLASVALAYAAARGDRLRVVDQPDGDGPVELEGDVTTIGAAAARAAPDAEQIDAPVAQPSASDGATAADATAGPPTSAEAVATSALLAERTEPVGRVYLTGAGDPVTALAAGGAAAATGAPLLVVDGTLTDAASAAIARLRPSEVVIVGGVDAVASQVRVDLAAAGHEVTRLDAPSAVGRATAVARHLHASGHARRLLLAPTTVDADLGRQVLEAMSGAVTPTSGPPVGPGGGLLLVDTADPVADPRVADLLADAGGTAVLVGAGLDDQAPRQVRAAAAGRLLPRGGSVLFPAHRMVAYYGNAQYDVLGVLGETTPSEAAEAVEDVAAAYADGERTVLPAFELIVSIATAGAGADGRYSDVGDVADARRYLEAAREHDMYLFLDFQPGRSRFIEQVRRFEDLLREPDVGVALDPEWRVTDSQRPGQVIGSADASELNEVAAYLAEIVREEDLPQKLFVVHQFRTSMIRDRDRLATPPELAVTIHVDGFGPQDVKLDTWRTLTPTDLDVHWGFKLFLDEDTGLFTPEQLLDFSDPAIDLVTYQ